MRRTRRIVGAAATCLVFVSAQPVAAKAAPSSEYLNDQLVTALLDPSGMPLESQFVNRIITSNIPEQDIQVQTAVKGIRYLTQLGRPAVSGDEAILSVGGNGQNIVSTIADFTRLPPVALHAEYHANGTKNPASDPTDLIGESGEFDIRYSVTNTSAVQEEIAYKDSEGVQRTKTVPVFAPLNAIVTVTLPNSTVVMNAPRSISSTDEQGNKVLRWNLVLYPPAGDFVQTASMRISTEDLQIPAARLNAVPVSIAQDPSTQFSNRLLSESLAGTTQLTSGLGKLDEGARKIADGASQLAAGQALAAKGTNYAHAGSLQLASGMGVLTNGVNQFAAVLRALSGSASFQKAPALVTQLANSLTQLRRIIGTPNDPPVPWPPPHTASLVQLSRALAAASSGLVDDLTVVDKNLESAQQSLSLSIAGVTTSVTALQSFIDSPACDPPTDCSPLASIKQQLLEANENADSAATDISKAQASAADAQTTSRQLNAAIHTMSAGILAISRALPQDSSQARALTRTIRALSLAVDQATASAGTAVAGVNALNDGSNKLASGLGLLAWGTNQLADGSAQLAEGTRQYQQQGTARAYREVVDASKDPAFAQAYLQAASRRSTESAPFPAPAGATATVGYVFEIPATASSPLSPALLGILAVLGTGLAVLVGSRLRRRPPTH